MTGPVPLVLSFGPVCIAIGSWAECSSALRSPLGEFCGLEKANQNENECSRTRRRTSRGHGRLPGPSTCRSVAHARGDGVARDDLPLSDGHLQTVAGAFGRRFGCRQSQRLGRGLRNPEDTGCRVRPRQLCSDAWINRDGRSQSSAVTTLDPVGSRSQMQSRFVPSRGVDGKIMAQIPGFQSLQPRDCTVLLSRAPHRSARGKAAWQKIKGFR